MPATVTVDGLTVVHQSSDGMVAFLPDVCLTPSPGGAPVPTPYCSVALSTDTDLGTTSVLCDGNPVMVQGSRFGRSTGNEAGTGGGVVSHVTGGAAEFIAYSFDVSMDGKPVCRMGDSMLGNKGAVFNTAPSPELQPPQPPCILAARNKDPVIDDLQVTLVDREENPQSNVRYLIKLPDGSIQEGRTDGNGRIKAADTVSGIGTLVFPDCESSELRPTHKER